jgi:hypothetical protein
MVHRSLTAVLRIAWLPTVAFVVAARMSRNFYVIDPYDPARTGTKRYGHNGEDSLRRGLTWVAIELAVALALLLPWPERWSRTRVRIGLGLSLCWTAVSIGTLMHGEGVWGLHAV